MSVAQSQARPVATEPIVRRYDPPRGLRESLTSALLRAAIRVTVKPFFGPPWGPAAVRTALHLGALSMPQDRRAQVSTQRIGPFDAERVTPKGVAQPRHAILYLHGGAFVAGSPRTHRSITRRLAALTGALVLVPHYRRIPEFKFPTQYDDAVTAYEQLLQEGYTPDRIGVAGDSAGGNMVYMLQADLRRRGLPLPAAAVMMSPALSHEVPTSGSVVTRADRDCMIRLSLAKMMHDWMAIPADHPLAIPKAQDLSQFPPSLIQVGDEEVLLDDSLWAVEALTRAGRETSLEIHMKRWHVFQAQSGYLASADQALQRQADFFRKHWAR